MFHGSYLPDDVTFLLKPVDIQEIDTESKEKLIQSGTKHYSEMISKEYSPSEEYSAIFYKIFHANKHRMATDLFYLADLINSNADNVVLVSLARAGTPVGVLLKRILKNHFTLDVNHYSISIIRDRGIDENALNYIIRNEPYKKIIFIDGWTGKGVISTELKKWITLFNDKYKTNISSELYVLSDISGMADFSATTEDYLIPSAILNSTVSGLISRSILNGRFIGPSDFHGCKFYKEFKEQDLSLWFVDEIMNLIKEIAKTYTTNSNFEKINKNKLREKSVIFIQELMNEYKTSHINYIKPGIGETTRVLLRRSPQIILVKDKRSTEIEHILQLAEEKDVPVKEIADLLYNAVGIIQKISK